MKWHALLGTRRGRQEKRSKLKKSKEKAKKDVSAAENREAESITTMNVQGYYKERWTGINWIREGWNTVGKIQEITCLGHLNPALKCVPRHWVYRREGGWTWSTASWLQGEQNSSRPPNLENAGFVRICRCIQPFPFLLQQRTAKHLILLFSVMDCIWSDL